MLNFEDFISENIMLSKEYYSAEEYLIDKGFVKKNGLWNYKKNSKANVIIEQKYFDLLIKNGELTINFGKIPGTFIMMPNEKTSKLKTLKGFEYIDCNTLDLSRNNIEKIGKIGKFVNLNLSNNMIDDISGLPDVIEGYLDLENNKITSLIGGPKHIKSFFDITNNLIKNLEGFPIVNGSCQISESIETFYGLKEFNRSINLDKSFKNVPEEEIEFLKGLKNGHIFENYVLELIEYVKKRYGTNNIANLNIPEKEIERLSDDIKNLVKSSKGLKKFNI